MQRFAGESGTIVSEVPNVCPFGQPVSAPISSGPPRTSGVYPFIDLLGKLSAMAFTWRYENASGAEVEPIVSSEGEHVFSTQGDAETWIGENWPALLAAGVEQVTLLESEVVVYGPMSLQESPPA